MMPDTDGVGAGARRYAGGCAGAGACADADGCPDADTGWGPHVD